MSSAMHLFVEDLKIFTETSIEWCSQESEEASTKILTAIDILLEDTQRVSALSQESLDAVKKIKSEMDVRTAEDAVKLDKFGVLIKGLKALVEDHAEIKKTINPILRALQFQDRMRQNLENMAKMITHWLDFRENLKGQTGPLTEVEEKDFGARLYKAATTPEERDLIHKSLPHSEKPEVVTRNEVEFF